MNYGCKPPLSAWQRDRMAAPIQPLRTSPMRVGRLEFALCFALVVACVMCWVLL